MEISRSLSPPPPERRRTKKCHSTQMFLRAIKLMDGTEVDGGGRRGKAGWSRLSLSPSACTLRVYQMRGRKKGRENTCLHFQAARFRKRERRRGYAERNECASVFRKHLSLFTFNDYDSAGDADHKSGEDAMHYTRAIKSRSECAVCVYGGKIREPDGGSDKAFLPPRRRGVLSITIFRVL